METTTLDQYHVQILARLFEDLEQLALRKILEAGRKLEIAPGEYVFRQGDREQILYIVLSGRLRAVAQDNKGTHILGDIGEGEPAGEFAIFTKEPRMASVLAIRKTIVLEITEQEYLDLITQNPAFAITLTSFLIKRLKRNALEQHMSGTPKNIALINLQAEHDLGPWTEDIERTLQESGIPTCVYDHDSQPEEPFSTIFDSLEQHKGLNVLVCSPAYPGWSRQSLIYADLVIVATDFTASHHLYEIEETLNLYAQSILNKKVYFVFLHNQNAPLPQNTSSWLALRKVDLHLHIRKHHAPDIRRFCRIISHQAVGVVLGGGGAKGFAHVGALRALQKAGIEIDFLGGTSAGALYGIGMSYLDFNSKKIDAQCKESAEARLTSNDYSLPFLSIMSGKKMNGHLKKMFGASELEDIWVTSYCVSTNFSRSGTRVHDRGLTSKVVQASIAVPGVFPPVVIDGQLHVDGGVVENLPIDYMFRYPVRHIIAISLSSPTSSDVDFTEVPNAWMLLWDKLTRKNHYKLPGIASIIINSLTLNSRQKQEIAKSKVSMYIELDLEGVGMMDDKKWRKTIEKGQLQASSYLENVPVKEKFWL